MKEIGGQKSVLVKMTTSAADYFGEIFHVLEPYIHT